MRFRTALLLKMYIFFEFKPEEKLEENGGGREGVMGNLRLYLRETSGGGLESFLRRENEKNLRYLLIVPKVYALTDFKFLETFFFEYQYQTKYWL